MAACGIGAAVYFFLGKPCGPGARAEALYAAALLLGSATVIYVTRGASQWWRGLAAGVGTAAAIGPLLAILAVFAHGTGGWS